MGKVNITRPSCLGLVNEKVIPAFQQQAGAWGGGDDYFRVAFTLGRLQNLIPEFRAPE
jgi:hypothetical protein